MEVLSSSFPVTCRRESCSELKERTIVCMVRYSHEQIMWFKLCKLWSVKQVEKYGTILEADVNTFLSLASDTPILQPQEQSTVPTTSSSNSTYTKCNDNVNKEDFSDLEKYKKPLYILDLINSLESDDPDRFNTAYINSTSLILTNPVDLSKRLFSFALHEFSENADYNPK